MAVGANRNVNLTATLTFQVNNAGNFVATLQGHIGQINALARQSTAAMKTQAATTRGMLADISGALKQALSVRAVIATMAKALVSGIAITALFGSIYAVFNTIRDAISGIINMMKSGLETMGTFQQSSLAMAAAMASSMKFSDDLQKNFAHAHKLAKAIQQELINRNAESIASIEELNRSMQVALTTGIAKYTKNAQEAVDVVLLLSNAIAAMTTGQNRSVQMAQEMRGIMTGTNREQAVLAKYLNQVIPGGLKEQHKLWAQNKNMVADIRKYLSGYVTAAQLFGSTLEGIKTTLISLMQSLQISIFQGLVDKIAGTMKGFFEALKDPKIKESIDRMTGMLSLGLTSAYDAFLKKISDSTSIKEFISKLDIRISKLAVKFPEVGAALGEVFADLLKSILKILELLRAGKFTTAVIEYISVILKGVLYNVVPAIIQDLAGSFGGFAMSALEWGGVGGKGTENTYMKQLMRAQYARLDIDQNKPWYDLKNAGKIATLIPATVGSMAYDLIKSNVLDWTDSIENAAKTVSTAQAEHWKAAQWKQDKTGRWIPMSAKSSVHEGVEQRDRTLRLQAGQAMLAARVAAQVAEASKEVGVAVSAHKEKSIADILKELWGEFMGRMDEEELAKAQISAIKRVTDQLQELRWEWLKAQNITLQPEARERKDFLVDRAKSAKKFTDSMMELKFMLEDTGDVAKNLENKNKFLEMWNQGFLMLNQTTNLQAIELNRKQGEEALRKASQSYSATLQYEMERLGKQVKYWTIRKDIKDLTLPGLDRTLTIEQKVNEAYKEGLQRLEDKREALVAIGRLDDAARADLTAQTAELAKQSDELREQLKLEDKMSAARQMLRRFRLQKEGVIGAGDRINLGTLLTTQQGLEAELLGGNKTEAEKEKLLTDIASIKSEIQRQFLDMGSFGDIAGAAIVRGLVDGMKAGEDGLEASTGSIVDMFKRMWQAAKKLKTELVAAFAQGIASAISAMIQGTGTVQQAIGGMIIAIGNLMLAVGTLGVLSGIFGATFGLTVGQGVALMAAGAAAIALGSAMGGTGATASGTVGGGGAAQETPKFSFNQAMIDVNNGMLTEAALNLNAAAQSFGSMQPGVVVKQGNQQNGGLLVQVAGEANSGANAGANMQLAKSLAGAY